MTTPSKPLKPSQVKNLNSPLVGTAIKWMSRAQTFDIRIAKAAPPFGVRTQDAAARPYPRAISSSSSD